MHIIHYLDPCNHIDTYTFRYRTITHQKSVVILTVKIITRKNCYKHAPQENQFGNDSPQNNFSNGKQVCCLHR